MTGEDVMAQPGGVTAPGMTPPSPGRPPWVSSLTLKLLKRDVQRAIVNVTVILVIGAIVEIKTGLFFNPSNLEAISIQIAVVTICACPTTLIMIAGAIDVSVAGTVALSGVVAGLLITHGVALPLAFVLATLTGVLVGLVNSFLVLVVGITSLISTIGTLYGTQGVANLLTNGLPLAGLPSSFSVVGNNSIGGIPIAAFMIVGVVAIFVAIQRYTSLGRYAVATGSNAAAAFLNGVNTRRTMTICFMLTGAAAGWGGVVYASRVGTPAPVMDPDLFFQVIVAIVVGGTSLFGGEGSVFGTLLGSVLIGVLNNGLDLLGVSTFWQYIALGALLVASVGSDTVMRRDSVQRVLQRWARGVLETGGPGGPPSLRADAVVEAESPIKQKRATAP
jgi:ribose/xylose/arabinose/galactoside ABC-type transport system permease subunit